MSHEKVGDNTWIGRSPLRTPSWPEVASPLRSWRLVVDLTAYFAEAESAESAVSKAAAFCRRLTTRGREPKATYADGAKGRSSPNSSPSALFQLGPSKRPTLLKPAHSVHSEASKREARVHRIRELEAFKSVVTKKENDESRPDLTLRMLKKGVMAAHMS